MARGKHATEVNEKLRASLREAIEARRVLERRIITAEKERDEAVAWRRSAEENGMPGILAERIRVEEAEARSSEEIAAFKKSIAESLTVTRKFIIRIVKMLPEDAAFIDMDEVPHLGSLFGDDIGEILEGVAGRKIKREFARKSKKSVDIQRQASHG